MNVSGNPPKFRTECIAVAWLLIPLCLSPLQFAHAYLDPGAGSYVIQLIIGILFGATYSLRAFFKKFWTWIKNRKPRE